MVYKFFWGIKMHNTIVITGATSGIGRATAKILSKHTKKLIIIGRREERLLELESEIGEDCKVIPVKLDVTDKEAVNEFVNSYSDTLKDLDVLINSAGLALGAGPFQDTNPDNFDQMIETNVKGLIRITRVLIPFLKEQSNSHIVNLGSIAGRWVYPGGSVYCATKYAVRAFSEGLRLDLCGLPIRVTDIEPGSVETEYSIVRLGSEEEAKKVYEGYNQLFAGDIAESILWTLNRPKHVNIAEMVIYPTDQAGVRVFNKK